MQGTAEKEAAIRAQAGMVAAHIVRLQGWRGLDALIAGINDYLQAELGLRGAYYRAQKDADEIAKRLIDGEGR